MKLLTILGISFYTVVVCLIGALIILFAAHSLPIQTITYFLELLYLDSSYRLITALSGFLLILISFSFAQLILGRMQRERTIAFNTPSGPVSVALSAVEDLIKRMCSEINEVKELRPHVVARKKGLEVDVRIVLKTETNIPELTARLQDMIKARIQAILYGLEEKITIRIHVAKIISQEEKIPKKDFDKPEHGIPYSGYTRT